MTSQKNLPAAPLGRAAKSVVLAAVLAAALGACGKSPAEISTAERVRLVEEKQKTAINVPQPRKNGETDGVAAAAPTNAQVLARDGNDVKRQ